MHHEFDSDGNFEERSLWVHKVSVENSDQARVMSESQLQQLMMFTCLNLLKPLKKSSLCYLKKHKTFVANMFYEVFCPGAVPEHDPNITDI